MKPHKPSSPVGTGSGAFAVVIRAGRPRARTTLPPESVAEGTQPVRHGDRPLDAPRVPGADRPVDGPRAPVAAPASTPATGEATVAAVEDAPVVGAAQALQPVRRPLLVYCGRCEQHHVALAVEREDDTVWAIDHHECQASFVAPVVRAAATDPIVLAGVRQRLQQALDREPRARRAASEHDVEVDAWTAPRPEHS